MAPGMGSQAKGLYLVGRHRFSIFFKIISPNTRFWQFVTDTLPPQDAACLAEDLGIEYDGPEHHALERDPLCSNDRGLKRKRA